MAGIKAFMSNSDKLELIDFIAENGENYNRYLNWAVKKGVQPFTPKYFHTWTQRRRYRVQVAREEYKADVKRQSEYTKPKRIKELENDVDTINSMIRSKGMSHGCPKCGEEHHQMLPEMILKLMDRKQKALEAIAKERNEWLKQEIEQSTEPTARQRLRTHALTLLENAKETKVVEGTIVVDRDKNTI